MSDIHIFQKTFKLLRNKLPAVIGSDSFGFSSRCESFKENFFNPIRGGFQGNGECHNGAGVVVNRDKNVSWNKPENFNGCDVHLPYLMGMGSNNLRRL